MNRRHAIRSLVGCCVALGLSAWGRMAGGSSGQKTRLGICTYCLAIRTRADRASGAKTELADPLGFLEYCHQLGAGGIQVPLKPAGDAAAARLRQRAEQYGMFVEGIAELPRDPSDLARFEAQVLAAKQAGARVIRVVMMPGRRYEQFRSAEEFHKSAQQGLRALQLAEPVAARHRVRLAVENHKDQRVGERLEVLRKISSEHVGACVDTGNSFTLLEDPMEVIAAYAPWAASVHLKDQAVAEYPDGFLFADVPLGEGFLDLAAMVKMLRAANPAVAFNLEIITRDPLKVPCLTPGYWATLADVPGRDLARTLRTVRAYAAGSLPRVSGLPLEEQARREEENVKRCLAYARKHLGL